MKKIILLITILLLCGFSKEIPFDIVVDISKFTDQEYMYKVIIDNPKEELKNIETIVIHDKETKDIFPSSGIFDDKYNLIPNDINKDNKNAKGIILIGYLPYEENIDITFKVLLKYETNDKINTIVYSTKKQNITSDNITGDIF